MNKINFSFVFCNDKIFLSFFLIIFLRNKSKDGSRLKAERFSIGEHMSAKKFNIKNPVMLS